MNRHRAACLIVGCCLAACIPAARSAAPSEPATEASGPPAGTGGTATTPRLVVYSNANTHPILKNADTLPYTHYILAFLIPDGRGGIRASGALQPVLDDPAAIKRIQAAGKKVMVSLGGGTVGASDWLTFGQNAEAVAESIAKVVEQHALDGVDLDIEAVPFEKRSAFEPYADAAIALTRAISARLPDKLLTHAPQPPYLCAPGSPDCPNDSLYATILASTGDDIDWLNMQYYSNPPVTSSDIHEIASYTSIISGWDGFPGIAPERLVVGKPYSPRVNGYEPLTEVTSKLLQPLLARYGNRFGGFMAWELSEDPDGTWAEAVNQVFPSD